MCSHLELDIRVELEVAGEMIEVDVEVEEMVDVAAIQSSLAASNESIEGGADSVTVAEEIVDLGGVVASDRVNLGGVVVGESVETADILDGSVETDGEVVTVVVEVAEEAGEEAVDMRDTNCTLFELLSRKLLIVGEMDCEFDLEEVMVEEVESG